MNAGVLGPLGGQPAQQRFGVSEASGLHINVGQPNRRFRALRACRVRINRQRLLIFDLGVGEFLPPLVQQACGNMRLEILWAQL